MSTTLRPYQPDQLLAGEEIAPGYRIVERLNRGNELDVYAGWSEERDCSCVVKVLRPDRRHDPRSRDRLLREGRLLVELCHPHLVRGYETAQGRSGVGPVSVMETLTGATLSRLIEAEHPEGLDSADVALLGLQLCSVLGYLHGHGVLHLDLKPSNMVAETGKIVLLDLSLAQRAGTCAAGMGTAEYMAPEQAAGGWVDTPTDVWGLSGVLYRAATGRRPFPSSDRERTAGDRVDLERLRRPGLHPALRELVAAGFTQAPKRRPTLADVRQGLLAALPADSASLLGVTN